MYRCQLVFITNLFNVFFFNAGIHSKDGNLCIACHIRVISLSSIGKDKEHLRIISLSSIGKETAVRGERRYRRAALKVNSSSRGDQDACSKH
jgi:hypothetical protein